jgi:hypothetical protein
MSEVDLLDVALDAAGGLERWREHGFLSAHLSVRPPQDGAVDREGE